MTMSMHTYTSSTRHDLIKINFNAFSNLSILTAAFKQTKKQRARETSRTQKMTMNYTIACMIAAQEDLTNMNTIPRKQLSLKIRILKNERSMFAKG